MQDYAGLAKDIINAWLENTRQELNPGLTKPNAEHWRDQANCEKALRSVSLTDNSTEDPSLVATQLQAETPLTEEEGMGVLKNAEKMDSFFYTFCNFNKNKQREIERLTLALVKESKMTEFEIQNFSFEIFEDILFGRSNIMELRKIFIKEFSLFLVHPIKKGGN